MNKILFLFLLISNFSFAGKVSDHFKPFTIDKSKKGQVKNIDYLYVINLDQRKERLESCLLQFNAYGIHPDRFPAVEGKSLSSSALNDLAVKFAEGMQEGKWVVEFANEKNNHPENTFLTDQSIGKSFFSKYMSLGGIGCTMSHLSVLQNAYDAGFETIWVMEDDVAIWKDPHLISQYIAKLDKLLGKKGWDILYTDTDKTDKFLLGVENDHESNLKGDFSFFWRPDTGLSKEIENRVAERKILSEEFVQVGSRFRTHSMIIRRSGMKKILDFAKNRGIFIPYDSEIALVPDIKLINLREDIVSFQDAESDISKDKFFRAPLWEKYKLDSLQELNQVLGWREPHKAMKIMEFIHEKSPQICVEIGAFGGAITYPIARALDFLKQGIVYAIDVWNGDIASEGLEEEQQKFWKNINFDGIFQSFQNLLKRSNLEKYCYPVSMRSQEAVILFKNETIDVLFLDGADTPSGSLEDIQLYFPKVKKGGYIWLNHADSPNKKEAVKYLMENCLWIKEDSLGTSCILFQKTDSL